LRVIKEEMNVEIVEIDFKPFVEVARSLYDGPFLAERLSAIFQFFNSHPGSIYPSTRKILEKGKYFTAVDTFLAQRRMEGMRKEAWRVWNNEGLHALVVPTCSITPTLSQVNSVPIGYNTVLGYYTNFVNLLDMCAMAVPNGFLPDKVGNGITFICPAWEDELTYILGRKFHSLRNLPEGATSFYRKKEFSEIIPSSQSNMIPVVVCGAHMSGLALNGQLLELGSTLSKVTKQLQLTKCLILQRKAIR